MLTLFADFLSMAAHPGRSLAQLRTRRETLVLIQQRSDQFLIIEAHRPPKPTALASQHLTRLHSSTPLGVRCKEFVR